LKEQNRLDEAERILREVVPLKYAILGPCNPRSKGTMNDLEQLLVKQGRVAEVPELYRKFLDPVSLDNLASEYREEMWKAY
jgi:hypothetical protein